MGQGFKGGDNATAEFGGAGGGGGSSEAGHDSVGTTAGKGGDGTYFSQFEDVAGVLGYFAAGGGGGTFANTPADGGLGGGGNGRSSHSGDNAVENTGSGGGGGGNGIGGNGAKGIFIARYIFPPVIGPFPTHFNT